ncbi:MAG: amidohydrolase [Anaerolineae bacterium]|nr:amidohydrolase [Anaerolineae bacterium]
MTAQPQALQTLALAERLAPSLVTWRRAIHCHPELGFREFKTAGLVARELRTMGIEFRTGVGKTGIVADIASDKTGRWVALRADMDALPIHEQNDCAYRSRVPGVMHACGHDAHTAMLLGAAALFAQHPPTAGGVRFIFQPCEEDADEEGLSGAQRMVAEGAMAGMSAVLALHVTPLLPVGKVGYDEAISASVDDFVLTLRGPGGHAASPHLTVDTVMVLGQVIGALYAGVPRAVDPMHPAVLTIGSVNGGHANNVIPSEIRLTGTLRARNAEARLAAMQVCERAVTLARALGAEAEWHWEQPSHPLSLNDAAALDALVRAARSLLGPDCVADDRGLGLGGEDFTYFAQQAPGAMLYLGARVDGHGEWHTPTFDVDERALPLGAAILYEGARLLMS